MEQIFSRQQAIDLSGLSSGQLSRLDKSGVVKPTKLGNDKHPTVLYSLSQVWELRTIAVLRQKLSMQEISKVITYLRDENFEPTLFGKFLLFCNDKLYWIASDKLGDKVVELSGRNKGQIVLKAVHPIGSAILNLHHEAKQHEDLETSKCSKKATNIA